MLVDTVRQLGPVDGCLYLMSRLIDRVSGSRCRLIKYFFVAQPVAEVALGGRRDGGAMRIRRVESSDPLVDAFPRPREIIAARYAQGALCFAAVKDGGLAGFLWLVHNQYEEDEVRCLFVPRPAAQVVWDFDVYLDPRYRLGRAFARLWDAAYEYLRARGVRWSMSRISAFNAESIRSHQRLGALRIGWAVFLTAGPMQLTICSQAPRVHLSLSRSSRPVLALHPPG